MKIGEEYTSYGRTVTETDVVTFLSLARMRSPMFLDAEASRASGEFGGLIAPGMLTATLAAGMLDDLVVRLGVVAALGMDEFRFRAPVKVGDTVRATITMADRQPHHRGGSAATLRVSLTNQRGEVPLSFSTRVLTSGDVDGRDDDA